MEIADEDWLHLAGARGNVHAQKQVAQTATDHQRVQVYLSLKGPDVDGNFRPHTLSALETKKHSTEGEAIGCFKNLFRTLDFRCMDAHIHG